MLKHSDGRSPYLVVKIHPVTDESDVKHPRDDWLPTTESRNGNTYFAAFHIISSNMPFQSLMLPLAFATLGWAWGTICLTIAFIWQLYTIFLLIELHESVPGVRRSRFLFLAVAAFGKRLGMSGVLFPVMYLSGGQCVTFIITGGLTLKLLFSTLCENTCNARPLTGVEWFLIFTCLAILIAQLPNLHAMTPVSFTGGVMVISYCTLYWALSVKDRPEGLTYESSLNHHTSVVPKIGETLNAIGIVFLTFRGHNVMLEIQGTLPSNLKETSKEPMRRAVVISYALIAMCVFPLGIAGYWAYGNKINDGGLITTFPQFHKEVTKFAMGAMYFLYIIHCLCSYQVYAMPVFDNLEIRYTSAKNRRCSRLVRACLRLFFGALTFFIAVTFPFLPKLSTFFGGMTLIPVTYAYPCFMWIALKKPRPRGAMWWFNVVLGCLGMLIGVLLVATAIWTLHVKGLHANFYKP
ncbi:hypothetical protein RJT34_31686 [Clitoria ternatea]|uniref:Amino acid transporter transmembrane domain-containing protein n=1 Tax=Clitoria ternatea TaxID=43366 RepID=A0AAN9I1K6_CLITE